MNEAGLRATIEGDVLGVVSGHGGEKIIAGPPMYQLVQELTDLTLKWRGDVRPAADSEARDARDPDPVHDLLMLARQMIADGDDYVEGYGRRLMDLLKENAPLLGGDRDA